MQQSSLKKGESISLSLAIALGLLCGWSTPVQAETQLPLALLPLPNKDNIPTELFSPPPGTRNAFFLTQEEWMERTLSRQPQLSTGSISPITQNRQTLGLLPEILHFMEKAPQSTRSSPPESEEPLFVVSDKPPAGFEMLNEPQLTVLTLYFDGRTLGSFEAKFTPTWVQFTHPEQLIQKIQGIQNKSTVIAALTGQLSPHADLICATKRPIPVCSIPSMEDASIVFDISNYRVDLFIAAKNLTPAARRSDLLPPPTAGRSFSDDLRLIIAGSTPGGPPSYNFIQQGALASGPKRINYGVSYSQTSAGSENDSVNQNRGQWSLQELNGEWDYKQYSARAGYIETIGDVFIGNQNILGIGAGTSLRTLRQDSQNTFGSPLVLFLSLPSQVSIYRDNRLISSGMYQAGEQRIDTTSFPIGSYPITIQIRDSLGNIREENQFFTKSTLIPPKEYPLYYADVGYLTRQNTFGSTNNTRFFPETTKTLLYQAGFNKRIGDSWGVNANVTGSPTNAYLGSGVFVLLPYYQIQLQPQVIVGTAKDYGVALTGNAYTGKLSLNLNARKLWATDRNRSASGTLNNTDFSNFDPLTQNQSQLNISAGYNIARTNITFNSSWSRTTDSSTTYSYGLTSRSNLRQIKNGSLQLVLSAVRSSTDPMLLTASLQWNVNTQNTNTTLSAGYQKDKGEPTNSGVLASANTTWRHLNAAQQGLTVGANINRVPTQDSVGLNIDEINRHLDFQGQTQYARQTGSDNKAAQATTQYSGNLNSRFIWAENSKPVFGGGRSINAGVIVDIASDKPGEEFQVLNNQQVASVVKTNSPTLVFLNGYNSYPISIKATSNSFFTYDETPKEVVLYPENYQYLSWKARQKLVILAQIVLPNHQPLPMARVEGSAEFAYTDDQGYVQLEIFKDTRELEFQQADDQRCKVQLPPNIPTKNSYASLKALVCTSLPGSKPMTGFVAPKEPKAPEPAPPPAAPEPPAPPPPAAQEPPAAPYSKRITIPWYRKEGEPERYFNLDGSFEEKPFGFISPLPQGEGTF